MKSKIYKALSLLLALAIVFSAGVCSFGTVSADTATYYVSDGGLDTNDGASKESPVATVEKAVELANFIYTTGDTVTIKVLGEEVSLGTLPTYNFDLVVEGIEETQTKIHSTSGRPNIANSETGKTYYKNVNFISDNSFPTFMMNSSKEVAFESDVLGFGGNNYVGFGSFNDGGATKTIAGQNVVFNNSVGIIYLGNSGWQNRTLSEDMNITIAGGGSPNFYFTPSSGGTAKYNKNLNINLKKANSVNFTNNGTVTVYGAFQIINSTSASITTTNSVLAGITGDKYIITNITGNKDIIEFTDTKGKFKVNTEASEYEVIATDKNGNVTHVDEQGYLTLTASGDYELSLYRPAQSATYYVSANGSDEAAGTKEAPLKTIGGAVDKAVANDMIKGDTVTVKLLGEKTIEWYNEQKTPTHPFKLIVESEDRNNYSKVNITNATFLGGPTEVKYGVYEIVDQYSQIRLNNNDFTIGDGANFSCLYYTFGDHNTSDTIAGQNVVFKNDISAPNIYLSNMGHSNSKKYSADVNVTVDNPFAAPTIRLSGQAGIVYYDANVNLIIKDANRITFSSQNRGTNVCNGAIQLITNSKTSVDPEGIEYLKTTCNPAKGFYHLINATEFKDLLSVTETAGKYAVDTQKYDVTASNGTNQFKAQDGFLNLTAGTYTITATQIKEETIPAITEKLSNATVNLWEQENSELNIDNAESVATIDFGDKTYDNVKINILNASKITFSGTPVINGSLHIAVNSATTVEGKAVVDAISAKGGKWYIINNSGENVFFGTEDGEVVYTASGKELEAVSGSTAIAPKFQNFLLCEGEYTIGVKQKAANQYDSYIDYRGSNLANTYAKIKNGEKLNVVYYGGSVTNGTGASSLNTTSWRGRIGQWLKNTYSNVEINNINAAIGATGTTFGSYRLDRYVIEQKPDLLFIEFSINDFYDFHYSDPDVYGRSAMQLETIIRRVRTELPECDIVVLHTIEKLWIDKARKGEFYVEAQAHNDIAKAYNIPTINLGGALANAMPDNWETVWSEYVMDLVHPTDKGYEIYYNVVKEYMTNCLLYTEHSTDIEKHTLPEMISDTLHDGDIKYIDANRELLEKSVALGGTDFDYKSGEMYLNDEFGSIVSTQNENSVFAIEFTGTELTMAINGSSNLGGFKVKIDDGEYVDVESINVSPRILATGLSSGKHTAYFNPVNSNSGNAVLNIIGFYTRDESKATHQHKFSVYASNNDATCQKNGTETAVCDFGCGKEDTREVANTIVQHKYTNYVPDNNATCINDGTKTAVCDYGCGTTDAITDVNSKLAHVYTEAITQAPTCATAGVRTFTCSVCGDIRTDIIAATGAHSWNNATCTTAKTCTVCNATEGTALGHRNVQVVTKATYKAKGSVVTKCSVCGVVSETKVIPKLVPKTTKISKLTAKKKSLVVKIKRNKSVTGYQIQYSLKKNFKSSKKVTLKKNSLTTKTIKKLKAKKTYYVRVRTFKTVNGKKYYSAWSKLTKKKTK